MAVAAGDIAADVAPGTRAAGSAAAAAPPRALLARARLVEEALRASAPRPSTLLGAMTAHHMGWTDTASRGGAGKMLRGALCLCACEALGGDPGAALPAAVAIEWVHNFTLIHDDVQDGDRERRHRPTVWAIWGEAQAINAGDALHALAHRLLAGAGADPRRVLRASGALDEAVLAVIGGQCLDLSLEGRPGTRPSTYLRLARAKTGALFGAALECGALLAGATAPRAARMRRAGRALGAAFQIRDDWLGSFGDPALTGKPRDGDLARRKLTHVVVSAYAGAGRAERARLRRLFADPAEAATPELRALVVALGAASRSEAAAADLADTAVTLLDAAEPAPAQRAEIANLAVYAARRTR